MTFLSVDGRDVHFEVQGSGPTVVLTSGGMSPGGAMLPLAAALADRYTVITWDRPNQGASQVRFDGPSELDLSARALSALIEEVGGGPALLIGASEGTRVNLRTALRFPGAVAAVFLWQVSAGEAGAPWMREAYYEAYVTLAETEGMTAVSRTPWWGERIKFNLTNRALLLETDVAEFAKNLRSWATELDGSLPVYGHTEDDLKQITAPTWVVGGVDEWHPEEKSRQVAELVAHGRFIPPPYDGADFDNVKEVWDGISNVFVRYADLPGVLPLIEQFLVEHSSTPV